MRKLDSNREPLIVKYVKHSSRDSKKLPNTIEEITVDPHVYQNIECDKLIVMLESEAQFFTPRFNKMASCKFAQLSASKI